MSVKNPDTPGPPRGGRRLWLVAAGTLTLAAGLATTWWRRQAATTTPVAAGSADTLRAWIDTLLPADGLAPGALALGVAERIAAAASGHAAYGRLLAAGQAWAEQQARESGAASFAALPAAAREALVERAERSPAGSTPRVFFQATLDDTHYHHWSDPRSWPALGYAGPPQPAGFMDHDRAPRT